MKEDSKTILIAGYYGFGNTGDEAILSAIVGDLRTLRPGLRLIVVSGNPPETEADHAVTAIPWMDIEAILQAVTACDLVILGGGGIFHDYWGVDPTALLTRRHTGISFFGAFPLLATMLNKPVMLYAIGVGPLFSEMGRLHTRAAFEQASVATVRDPDSKKQLKAIGVDTRRIRVTADPAFRLQPTAAVHSPHGAQVQSITQAARPMVGVALREWNIGVLSDYWERQVALALDGFLDRHGGTVVFIPFQHSAGYLQNDFAVAERVRNQMRYTGRTIGPPERSTLREKIELISRCDLILGMRLHSLIFAVRSGVPAAGLIYDPKVRHLMARVGCEECALDLGAVTAGRLSELMTRAYQNRETLALQFRRAGEALATLARRDARLAVRLLDAAAPAPPPMQATVDQLKGVLLSHTRRLLAQEAEARAQAEEIGKRDRRIADLQAELTARLSERDRTIADLQAEMQTQVGERERIVANLRTQVGERDRTIIDLQAAMQTQIGERDLILADLKASLQAQLGERDRLIAELRTGLQTQVGQRDQLIADLQAELQTKVSERDRTIADLQTNRANLQKQVASFSVQLTSIAGSRGWKLLWWLWEVRLWIAPRDSRRERFLLLWLHGLSVWKSEGFRALGRKIRRRLLGSWPWMSWYAFAFDRYKRARLSAYEPDLSPLQCPSEPGLVSIVLPVYNGADFIHEALDSILKQTYSNFELIAIDDGCTDATGAILDEYARRDARVRVIHQENRKIPRALSRGFRVARGEYLTWTSSDNRLRPDFLEKMVSCLRRHSCWDMIYANIDIIGGDSRPLRNSGWYKNYEDPPGSEHIYLPEDPSELNTWANNHIGGAFLYRDRVAFLLGDYSPLRFTAEDYDYWMRINALFNLRHADFQTPVYEYRFHDGSLTHRDEELGITRDRVKLMVFDDFRRDFYLTPLGWVIEADQCNPGSQRVAVQLRQQVERSGHTLLERTSVSDWPQRWLPIVYARITADRQLIATSPIGLPEHVFKTAIYTGVEPLPAGAAEGWHLCIGTRPPTAIPRLDGDYRGWLIAPEPGALFTALDIRARSRHLSLIETALEGSPMPGGCRLTVVLCTYERHERLAQAVRSVAHQTLPQAVYEVLVVNNEPEDDEVEELITALRASYFTENPDCLRYVVCPLRGLAHARNAGISEARGEILCFLDDDVIAPNTWLEQIWKAFAGHPEVGVVGGPVRLKLPDPPPDVLKPGWEVFWSQFLPGDAQYTEVAHWWEFPWGANWCARRKALLEIGGFRTRYGRRGNNFGGGEEIVAASLIQRLGYKIATIRQPEVLHDVEPERYTPNHIWRSMLAAAEVNFQAQKDLYLPMESGIYAAVKQILSMLLDLLGRRGHPAGQPASRSITLMRIGARLSLISRELHDYWLRGRRPVALADNCRTTKQGFK